LCQYHSVYVNVLLTPYLFEGLEISLIKKYGLILQNINNMRSLTFLAYIYLARHYEEQIFRLRTGHEGSKGEWRYKATLSLSSALDGLSVQRHALAALPPGKGRLVGHQGRCGKLYTYRDSIPGPPSLYRVSIQITLFQAPPYFKRVCNFCLIKGFLDCTT
jgi:hypothetical protein